MIKLETSTGSLAASSLLTIQSHDSAPTVALGTSKVRSNKDGKWEDDVTRLKQVLTFFTPDGPCEISGIVAEQQAVEIASAHKVLVEVQLSTKSLPAYEAGRVSRSLVALEVVRVVQVWASPTKCVWEAHDFAKKPAKSFDPTTGKIAAA